MIKLNNKRVKDVNARKALEEVKLEIAEEFGRAHDINVGNVTKIENKKAVDKQSNKKK